MKNLFLFVFICFLLGCSKNSKPENYELDDTLYKCTLEYFKTKGVDFEKSIDSVELFLLKNGILKDTGTESLFNFLKQVEETNTIPRFDFSKLTEPHVITDFSWVLNLKICNIQDTSLNIDEFDSSNSIIIKISEALVSTNFENKTWNSNRVTLIKVLPRSLSKKDLKHPLIKAYALAFLYLLGPDHSVEYNHSNF
jgi:hypothetical protein